MLLPGLMIIISGSLLIAYAVFAVNRSRKRRAGRSTIDDRSVEPGPVVARLPQSLAAPSPPDGLPSAVPVADGIVDQGQPPVAAGSSMVGPAASPAADDGEVLPRLAAGVTLPCDLTPLIDVAPRPEATERVVFVTTSFPGEVVQRELEASFEAEGGHISWYTADVGVVRRNDVEANVALHLSPHAVSFDKSAAYPTAPLGSVVVDLWV